MKSTEFVYLYKNKEYPVHVTCKYQRNIYYRYKEDGFHVSAPYLVTKKAIVKGLDKFADKILAQYENSHSHFSFEKVSSTYRSHAVHPSAAVDARVVVAQCSFPREWPALPALQ